MISHASPVYPGGHVHWPRRQRPLPEHPFGQSEGPASNVGAKTCTRPLVHARPPGAPQPPKTYASPRMATATAPLSAGGAVPSGSGSSHAVSAGSKTCVPLKQPVEVAGA